MIRERKLVIRIKKKAGRPMADTSPALPARQRARLGLALCGALLLAGCGYNKLETGTVAYVEGFAGIIVGDEPRAVLIGRDILTTGGSAADAAVAMGHALAVTLPSRAGLGGGGVCVAYDVKSKTTEALEFYASRPELVPPGAATPTAVPSLTRGLYLLHSKYGRLRWERILIQPEILAREENQVSRALAKDLALAGDHLLDNPDAAAIFRGKDGQVLREGDFFAQHELAAILSNIRSSGPGDFYAGSLSRQISEAYRSAGGTLSFEDLRQFRPKWVKTVDVKVGNNIASFPPPPSAGGLMAQMLEMLVYEDTYAKAPADAKAHVLAEVQYRAFADRGEWMTPDGASKYAPGALTSPRRLGQLMTNFSDSFHAQPQRPPSPIKENPASTGFVVVDNSGNAVSCALTMNNLFGAGKVAPGTGMLMAAAPDQSGRGPSSLAPMLMINPFTHEFWFGGAGTGGAFGPTSLIEVFARAQLDNQPLSDAMKSFRLHAGSTGDLLFLENSAGAVTQSDLESRGHKVVGVGALGSVNAAFCPEGIPSHQDACQREPDSRADGLGILVGQE